MLGKHSTTRAMIYPFTGLVLFLILFCFLWYWGWITQYLTYARQVLYHLSHSTSHLFWFWDIVLIRFLRLAWNVQVCVTMSFSFLFSFLPSFLYSFLPSFLFVTGSHYVPQASLELAILLPQPPKCWNFRCAPPDPHSSYCTLRAIIFPPIFYFVDMELMVVWKQGLRHSLS
jgi:hypothetical protein